MSARLGLPLSEAQQRVSSSEFVLWQEYFRKEDTKLTKQDYYLAQIAMMVAMANSKNPNRLKISDFLLKFRESGKHQRRRQSAEEMKAILMAVVGVK